MARGQNFIPEPKVILSAFLMGIFSTSLASGIGSPVSSDSISCMVGRPMSAGRSRVMTHATTARTTVMTPSTRNTCCHPTASDISASGPAALRAPMFPTASSMPDSEANSFLRYHVARIFMMGMYTIATPTPIRTLPAMTSRKLDAIPVRIAPTAATKVKMLTVFRGPQLSVSRPEGSCIMV